MSENQSAETRLSATSHGKSWQQYWDENKTFKTGEDPSKPNFMHWICSLIHPVQDSRRSPGRIYGNGYRFSLQTDARL